MTDAEINAIIAQAANDNPSVRMATTVVTSEEVVSDAQAAFLEALGETPDTSDSMVNIGAVESSAIPEEAFNPNEIADQDYEVRVDTAEVNDVDTLLVNRAALGEMSPDEDEYDEDDEDLDEEENTEEEQPLVDNTLPENSDSIHLDETTSRFSDAIWYNKIQEKIITLAGLGGIGSYVAFLLARMKPCAIYLYDDDEVEAANMSGQLYGKTDVGHKKVDSMASMVKNYADYGSTFCMAEKFTEDSEASDIMICGFDNMKARYTFYHKWLQHVCQKRPEGQKNCLFIDGRLAAESMQVFCITGDDNYSQKRYTDKWLFADSQADATMCSYKQTTFCANLIGSLMTNLFVNFCANECNPLIPRDLPFLTSYEAETLYFKTEN